MNKPVVIVGAGGHALVLLEILIARGATIVGVVAPSFENSHTLFRPYPKYTGDDAVYSFDANEVLLVNGVGSLPGYSLRKTLSERFTAAGYCFASVISPRAIVSPSATLAEGVQVMAGAIIQVDACVGAHTIINTSASIDHGCRIGSNNHIAPGVTLSGDVVTGDNVHIGTGASVIQGMTIGEDAVIGAGAIVTQAVDQFITVFGHRSETSCH